MSLSGKTLFITGASRGTVSYTHLDVYKRQDDGYARDFIEVLTPLLDDIATKNIRVISNAGGVNPMACAAALSAACEQAGVQLKIAVLHGDNLQPKLGELVLSLIHISAEVAELLNRLQASG